MIDESSDAPAFQASNRLSAIDFVCVRACASRANANCSHL